MGDVSAAVLGLTPRGPPVLLAAGPSFLPLTFHTGLTGASSVDVNHVHALERAQFLRCITKHICGISANPWSTFEPAVAPNERTALKLCFSHHQLHHFASVTSAVLSSYPVQWGTGVITLKAWPPHTLTAPPCPVLTAMPSPHAVASLRPLPCHQ